MRLFRRQKPHAGPVTRDDREWTPEDGAATDLVIEELEARLTPDDFLTGGASNPGRGTGFPQRHVGWGC
jgi:hypothetical protein